MNSGAFKYIVMLILLAVLLAGCAAGQAATSDFGSSTAVSNLEDDMTMEEVKEFLLAADGVIGDVATNSKPTGDVIANHHSNNIVACTGDYSSFDSVMKTAGSYFLSPEIVEKELYMANLFNIHGKIGMATDGGEDRYGVCLESTVSMITNDDSKKELHVDAYNGAGETTPLTYTIEKKNGVWRISDIQGYGWPVKIDDVLKELSKGAWAQH